MKKRLKGKAMIIMLMLLMIIGQAPGASLIALADEGASIDAKLRFNSYTSDESKCQLTFDTLLTIPGIEWSIYENMPGYSYNDSNYCILLIKGNEIKQRTAHVSKANTGMDASKNEETNEYYYNWRYSRSDKAAECHIWYDAEAGSAAGEYTIALYRQPENYLNAGLEAFGTPIAECKLTIDEFILSGNGKSRSVAYTKDNLTDSSCDVDFDNLGLTKDGKVIESYTDTDSDQTIAVGSDDKDAFNTMIASDGAGKVHHVTLNYIDNVIPYPDSIAWSSEKTGLITGAVSDTTKNSSARIRIKADGEYHSMSGMTWRLSNIKHVVDDQNKFSFDTTQDMFAKTAYTISYAFAANEALARSATYKTSDSTYTPAFTERLAAPSSVEWDGQTAKWSPVEGAGRYLIRIISINTDVEYRPTVDADKTSFDASNWIVDAADGEYRFQIMALSNDLNSKGNSRFSDLSDVCGLSDDARTAKEAINTAATAVDNLKYVAAGNMTDEQKASANNAVNNLKSDYTSAEKKEALREAIQSDAETRTQIDELAGIYANANNITTLEPDIASDVKINANNLKVVGAELNVPANSSVRIKLTNPASDPTYDTETYSNLVAFNMNLVDGNGKKVEKETNLDIPVTIKLPVPNDMNPMLLRVLHYINGSDKTPEMINPTYETIDGITYAVFTIRHFSTFAFVELEKSSGGGETPSGGDDNPSGGGGGSGDGGGGAVDPSGDDTPSGGGGSGGGGGGGGGAAQPEATEADKAAASNAVSAIDKIPAEITLESAEDIVSARNAYDALSDTQKALVDAAAVAKLNNAEKALTDKLAEAINAIPDVVTLEDENAVKAAAHAYSVLPESLKARISGAMAEKLAAAESTISAWNEYVLEQESALELIDKTFKLKAKAGKKVYISLSPMSPKTAYQVRYSTSKKFTGKTTKTVNVKAGKKSTVLKKLKARKTYYVKIRPVTVVTNKATGETAKIYGKWSKARKVKTKRK